MNGKHIIHRRRDAREGRALEELAGGLERIEALSRRRFLKGAAAVAAMLVLPWRRALAQPEEEVKTGVFVFSRLKFVVMPGTHDIWNAHPIGDVILRRKLRELTNLNVSEETKVVELSNMEDMYKMPYVFATSENHFEFPPNEAMNLREYLERGGFVHADDCVAGIGQPNDWFFQSYLSEIEKLFPDNPMREIPLDHELFHIYYDFPNGSPHMQGGRYRRSNAAGLFEPGTDRLMTVATPGDLHCGWVYQWFTPEMNMEAIKMGINIVIYALSH